MTRPGTTHVVSTYRRLAPEYDRRWSFYTEATVRETRLRLGLEAHESLLDVGCGTGALLLSLATSVPGARLAGVDPTLEMLEVAREKLGDGVGLMQSHAEQLPFAAGTFDVVVCTNAFHYFRNPIGALVELARVLRPGGRLVITDWCDDYLACWLCDRWLRVFDRAHFRTYGTKECRRLVEQADLAEVRIDRFRINWLWGLMTVVGRKPAQRPQAA